LILSDINVRAMQENSQSCVEIDISDSCQCLLSDV